MAPSGRRTSSLKINLNDITPELPPIAAAFLIYFDIKAGYASRLGCD